MYLQLQKVNKIFENTDKESLSDISLEVGRGEFICIVGPSGCGKSTLLNLVAGLTAPTSGQILLEGEPVGEPGPDRVMMFQEAALFPWLNVRQNVMFALEAAGHSKAEQLSLSEQYLRMVSLWHYRDYPIHQISGGMKQRTALARALAMDSRLLLMDEPFSALDKQTINVLREELEEIWEQTHKTILYVTHSVEEAIYFADRVVVMSENPGRIREIIPVALARPRHLENEAFVALRQQILQSVRDGVRKSIQSEFDSPRQEETHEN
ncbi:MAG: ABC transporter ATP-binding protein [Muribaculaceae bacterium]|nr:ABC transporter ATP-binding protein [Roseburia sp.]MCM1432300.1 ABC transporter ATP-binding protein [Muribaculaceae bacterium]MCM1491761.1 ABC transporter ATP-binding protein [Muribaculaceae bacterium]